MSKLIATGSRIAGLVVAAALFHPSQGQAQQTLDPETQNKVLKGLQLAPVPLNMVGKDPVLVGLGSYIVNAGSGCNDCHSAGPQTQYIGGGNPFFGQHQTVNPVTYMGGGRDFGAFPDPAGPFPHIVSRNLTPDGSGLPEGGNTLAQFTQIMRTGVDMDHVHPTCSAAPNGTCLPAPFNGDLLQIMPWPVFQSFTDNDILAIYTYLSALPCIEGGPGEPPNRCVGAFKTAAVAGPKNLTATSRTVQLDGTQSTSADGKPLSFLWTIPQGSPSAAISGSTTATPTVQLTVRGTYTFQLTVTDSTGKSSTDSATVNY
ncbi:MAG TPA: PKD domain-containing protein [Bryobacteraceae bacterium]|nr:PKD domain-containing protein [Bryobacteraceae bacterium]